MSESRNRVGYARVSTIDQDPSLQIDALREAGCSRIFTEHASGSLRERPELSKALDYLRAGDTLVVWRLDRLGRSLRHLIDTVGMLQGHEIALMSLHESINTGTPTGRLTLHIFASLAEFERELTIERTQAGLAAARARGRKGGRPTVLTAEKRAVAESMYQSKTHTIASIARTLGVSRATLYRHLSTTICR